MDKKTDAFGRTASGPQGGNIDSAATFTTKATATEVEDALRGYTFNNAAVFMNGVDSGDTVSDFAGLAGRTMNSLLVEVFAAGKEINRVTLIALSLGMVTDVDDEEGTVRIASIGYPLMDAFPFKTTCFKKGDIVVFTDSFDTATFKATIHFAAPAPSIDAVLTSFTGSTLTGGCFTAGDKAYYYSAVNSLEYKYGVYPEGFPPGTLIDAPAYIDEGGKLGDEVTVFLDLDGYAIHIVNTHGLEEWSDAIMSKGGEPEEESSLEFQQGPETGTDAPASGDLAGKWDITVQSPAGEQTGVMDFRIDGNALEGSLTNEDGVTTFTDGKVKGDQFTFKIKLKTPVGEIKFTVTGVVEGDRISGKWKMVMGSLAFSGVRTG